MLNVIIGCCLVTKLRLTVLWPHRCSPSGCSVHGISQVRIPEWVAISFSRESSWLRDWTHISHIGRRILYHWATWEFQSSCYISVFQWTVFWDCDLQNCFSHGIASCPSLPPALTFCSVPWPQCSQSVSSKPSALLTVSPLWVILGILEGAGVGRIPFQQPG